MIKKFIVLILALASVAIFLPSEGKAAVSSEKNTSATVAEYANGQIRVRIGTPRRRYRRVYGRPYYNRRYYAPRRTIVVRRNYGYGRRYRRY